MTNKQNVKETNVLISAHSRAFLRPPLVTDYRNGMRDGKTKLVLKEVNKHIS